MVHLVLTLSILGAGGSEADRDAIEFFENRVRPLLLEHCAKCHSSTRKAPKGGLVLDTPGGWLAGGDSGPALVAGDPGRSRIIRAVRYEDPNLEMPPRGKLSEREIADLVRWVEMGAPAPAPETGAPDTRPEAKGNPAAVGGAGPRSEGLDIDARRREHWCWQPLQDPPPDVAHADWPRSDIDRFILARLEAAGLSPSEPASRLAYVRRVAFDLTGLPPSREAVETFLAGDGEAAFEALVDGLLESPGYAEHWAQHWLDLVRFAETRGHEQDIAIPEAWRYRDYAIRAFLADVPYDRFLIEHVAGDLVEEPRLDPVERTNQSIQGTGFWHLGEATHSPVDIRGDEADRVHNQIDVFSKTFLGLSLGCARCHDHKFDAVSTRDYYAMFGYLQSSSFQLADVSDPVRQEEVRAGLEDLEERALPGIRESLARFLARQVERLPAYLLAAREVLRGAELPDLPPAASENPAGAILFEGFERPGYDGWIREGTAFGASPQRLETFPEYQGDPAAIGRGFVNSHNVRDGGDVRAGDAHTGTLTSREFTVERRYIHFLIGGGAREGRTCLEVLAGGNVVLSATGRNSNRMAPAALDASPYLGRTVRIRIADREQGPWGNIGVDHIVFSDSSDWEDGSIPVSADLAARTRAVARARALDDGVLARLARHLESAAPDPADPLHTFALLAHLPGEPDAAAVERAVEGTRATWARLERESRERLASLRVVASIKDGERNYIAKGRPWSTADTVVDYGAPGPEDWIPSGHRFGRAPLRIGELLVRGDGDGRVRLEVVARGRADGSVPSGRMTGFLRTPTFEVTGDRLWYRMRGSCDVFLAVDSHRVVTGPLHGVVKKKIEGDPEAWKWHSHEVRDYIGHRIHAEFTPGEGFAIERIVFAESEPPELFTANELLADALLEPAARSLEGVASAIAGGFAASVDDLARGELSAGARDGAAARLCEWLLAGAHLLEPEPALESALASRVARYLEEKARLEARLPEPVWALALLDGSGEDEPVHIRGNHRNLAAERVPRAILTALREGEDPAPARGSGRLELARRLASRSNPLVPRVIVNRVWHHLFGRGIVETPDDFGIMGARPSHPELLDHLARRFMEGGWSFRRLIREVVLSSTYRMSSRPRPEAERSDPENKLLHRVPIRRLPAEAIRDAMLAVSGRLDRTLFGPSVPVHLTPFLRGSRSPSRSGPLDGAGRRSIYIEVRRNHLSPMLRAFDKPIPFTTIGRRSISNSPLQPLILLNDPFVHEQASVWAKRLLAAGERSDRALVEEAFFDAFSRPATENEVEAALAFVEEQAKAYDESARERALADLCHTLFNVKEFIFVR